jgi:hypothetical protein
MYTVSQVLNYLRLTWCGAAESLHTGTRNAAYAVCLCYARRMGIGAQQTDAWTIFEACYQLSTQAIQLVESTKAISHCLDVSVKARAALRATGKEYLNYQGRVHQTGEVIQSMLMAARLTFSVLDAMEIRKDVAKHVGRSVVIT